MYMPSSTVSFSSNSWPLGTCRDSYLVCFILQKQYLATINDSLSGQPTARGSNILLPQIIADNAEGTTTAVKILTEVENENIAAISINIGGNAIFYRSFTKVFNGL